MVDIKICVGSACHLKGSHDVIDIFQDCVRTSNTSHIITIKGAFCLGHCTEAVSVLFLDTIYSVNRDNARDFFNDIVLKSVRRAK